MARVYVSIGSNIERAANIRAGVRALRARFDAVDLSRVWDTAAVGFAGDDFYNLVAGFDSDAPVHAVAAFLREAEAACGRTRPAHGNGFVARTLDMDLLLYGDLVLEEAGLHLPRDEILRYAFVLAPLAEIAGSTRHPVLGRTFAELWAAFPREQAVLRPIAFDWDTSGAA